MKKRTIPSEFEGHFFLTTNQVCELYNFSPKTLKRREKDQTIPIPPRVQISKNRYGYRTDLTFDCLEKISSFLNETPIYIKNKITPSLK